MKTLLRFMRKFLQVIKISSLISNIFYKLVLEFLSESLRICISGFADGWNEVKSGKRGLKLRLREQKQRQNLAQSKSKTGRIEILPTYFYTVWEFLILLSHFSQTNCLFITSDRYDLSNKPLYAQFAFELLFRRSPVTIQWNQMSDSFLWSNNSINKLYFVLTEQNTFDSLSPTKKDLSFLISLLKCVVCIIFLLVTI